MNNYGKNRMLRIAAILEWLDYRDEADRDDGIGDSLGLTISYLAKVLRVPVVTIRNDIYELASYANLRTMIYSADDPEEDQGGLVFVDKYGDSPRHRALVFSRCTSNEDKALLRFASGKVVNFEKLIKDGYFDDVPLSSKFLEPLNSVNRIVLVLQDEEMEMLREFASENGLDLRLSGKRSVYYKNLQSVSDTDMYRLEKIMESQCLERKPGRDTKIRFYYDSPFIEGIMEKVVVPLMIEQDLDAGFLYLIAEGEQQDQPGAKFRLDRMIPFNEIEGEKTNRASGMRSRNGEERFFEKEKNREAERETWDRGLTHVKIKVFDRHGFDIHSRVMRDLRRMHIGNVYSIEDHMTHIDDETGNYYIYEDDVSNIGKLKSWVFSYGSSMVVVEPESVREQVIASYRKRSEYYKGIN